MSAVGGTSCPTSVITPLAIAPPRPPHLSRGPTTTPPGSPSCKSCGAVKRQYSFGSNCTTPIWWQRSQSMSAVGGTSCPTSVITPLAIAPPRPPHLSRGPTTTPPTTTTPTTTATPVSLSALIWRIGSPSCKSCYSCMSHHPHLFSVTFTEDPSITRHCSVAVDRCPSALPWHAKWLPVAFGVRYWRHSILFLNEHFYPRTFYNFFFLITTTVYFSICTCAFSCIKFCITLYSRLVLRSCSNCVLAYYILHIVRFRPATFYLTNGPISVVQRLYYSHACRLINNYYIFALSLPVLLLLRLMFTPYNQL